MASKNSAHYNKTSSYLLPRKTNNSLIRPGNPTANFNIKATQNLDLVSSFEQTSVFNKGKASKSNSNEIHSNDSINKNTKK